MFIVLCETIFIGLVCVGVLIRVVLSVPFCECLDRDSLCKCIVHKTFCQILQDFSVFFQKRKNLYIYKKT